MPYIKEYLRGDLIDGARPDDAGELNFKITDICNTYLKQHGKTYGNINEVVGALECAKLELYRRIAVPYEDLKIKENGDVYTV